MHDNSAFPRTEGELKFNSPSTTQMNDQRLIAELRRELELLDRAILFLEHQEKERVRARFHQGREKHRPRTPKA